MSRKKRRQRNPRRHVSSRSSDRSDGSSSDRPRVLPGAVLVIGLILICFAFLTINLTARTIAFWIYRNDYTRTELEVTELIPGTGDSDSVLIGIVAATGDEIHSNQIPTELMEFSSPRGVIGTVMNPAAARGKKIPIWYARDHQAWFTSANIQFASEFDTLPSSRLVLGIVCVNLALFALAAWCIVFAKRRLPTSSDET
jgi:hypothetical protein